MCLSCSVKCKRRPYGHCAQYLISVRVACRSIILSHFPQRIALHSMFGIHLYTTNMYITQLLDLRIHCTAFALAFLLYLECCMNLDKWCRNDLLTHRPNAKLLTGKTTHTTYMCFDNLPHSGGCITNVLILFSNCTIHPDPSICIIKTSTKWIYRCEYLVLCTYTTCQ